MMNLEWYRTFIAIYEKHTLTKAAEYLYTSQPGVSVHLNALESYIGKKLFERTSRKMIPTEDGKLLYSNIIEPIKKLERAEQHFKRTSKDVIPSINIGMCTETFQTILENEVPTLPFNLVAKFGEHQDLMKDLNKGLLDLVITPRKHDKYTLTQYEAFAQEHIVMVAGSDTDVKQITALIEEQNFDLLESELKTRVWYSASNEMEHFRRFWYESFKKRVDFKPNYILPNIGSIIRCIENNNGFAIVPDFLVKSSIESNKVKLVWRGKKAVSNTLYFATREDLKFKKEINCIKDIFIRKMKNTSVLGV
ncbi:MULTISPECIES: LysR family transcriptional regulator [Nonlabens]|uniref:LysR family transcriptional regulator n=1 Tax=Nonlabens TaxID=363408 RepID=UPI001428C4DB|nr:LysR family transcriptional regulator [Nonlabens sp. SY33080]